MAIRKRVLTLPLLTDKLLFLITSFKNDAAKQPVKGVKEKVAQVKFAGYMEGAKAYVLANSEEELRSQISFMYGLFVGLGPTLINDDISLDQFKEMIANVESTTDGRNDAQQDRSGVQQAPDVHRENGVRQELSSMVVPEIVSSKNT